MKKFKAFLSTLVTLAVMLTSLPFAASAQENNTISLRIEGASKNIINSENVAFNSGENLYSVFKRELESKGVLFDVPEDKYGHIINSIGGETGGYPVWWHIYVNGKASDYGIDGIIPKSGDDVVLYIGNDDLIKYPTFKFTPENPKAGENVTVNVSSTYTDYSAYPNVEEKTELISGVKLTCGDTSVVTDKDGNATLKVPADGKFFFSAEKEKKDTTSAIVRMPKVGVAVKPMENTTPVVTETYDKAKLESYISSSEDYLTEKSNFMSFNDALALRAVGKSVPEKFAQNVKTSLETDGTLNPTNIAGFVIGLRAAGFNPENFDGRNLVRELYNEERIGKTGLNGYCFALLAFNSGKYNIPNTAKNTKESLKDTILTYQTSNGAFTLDKGSVPDVDMTAIALTALAPYKNEAKVKSAIDKGVDFLSKSQKADGGFNPSYSENETSETISQVIIALSTLGIDSNTDTRFVKNKKSALDALVTFRNSDGGFAHIKGNPSDDMATAQALQALASFKNLKNGTASIFDLESVSADKTLKVENPKTEDNTKLPIAICFAGAALIGFSLLLKKKH